MSIKQRTLGAQNNVQEQKPHLYIDTHTVDPTYNELGNNEFPDITNPLRSPCLITFKFDLIQQTDCKLMSFMANNFQENLSLCEYSAIVETDRKFQLEPFHSESAIIGCTSCTTSSH